MTGPDRRTARGVQPPRGAAQRRPFADPPAHARQYAMPLPDGVRLATDVYVPAAGRGPVLLTRVPYDKAGAESFQPQVADWFAERGYVVVVQDVRGKVRSGGVLAPFDAEISDGYHTLDWITQQSWCAGPIGMFGDSYYGFTTWAAAAGGHPALQAIATRVTSSDLRPLLSRQGVLSLELAATWALETWVDEALYEYEAQLDWTVRPQSEIVSILLGGRRPVGLDDWATGRLPNTACVPVTGDIPTLHLGGFSDLVLRGQIATWQRSRTGAGADFLILDARDHGWTPHQPAGVRCDEPRTDDAAEAFLADYLGPLLPFFDHFLRQRATYSPALVRWRLDDGPWREDVTWPPLPRRPSQLFLTRGGGLASDPDNRRTEHWQRWCHDPAQPVPSLVHPYRPLAYPVDEQKTIARPDVLRFTSAPQHTAAELAGPASVRVWIGSSAPSAHLMSCLYDIDPDGSAYRIADGAAHLQAPWPALAMVDLGTVGHHLEADHHLALTIAASSYPRYALHPATADDPWSSQSFGTAEQEILLGGPRSAALTCFTVSGEIHPTG